MKTTKVMIKKPSRPVVLPGAIVETTVECARLLIRSGNAEIYEEPVKAPKKTTRKTTKKTEE